MDLMHHKISSSKPASNAFSNKKNPPKNMFNINNKSLIAVYNTQARKEGIFIVFTIMVLLSRPMTGSLDY